MNVSRLNDRRPSCFGGWVVFLCGSLFSGSLALGCGGAPPRAPVTEIAKLPPARAYEEKSEGFSGAELCFNGLDDNRNTLIDEGCGVRQGQVQFVLAWDEEAADLDLYVTDPDGEIATNASATLLGLTLSPDCPKDKRCAGQNFENAFLEELDTPCGNYRVRIRLEKLPPGRDQLLGTLGVRLPGGTRAYRLEFFAEGQEIFLEFDVESADEKE